MARIVKAVISHLDEYFRQAGHLEMIMVKMVMAMVNIKMMVERDDDEDPPDQAILVEIKPYRLNAEQQVGLDKSFICTVWTGVWTALLSSSMWTSLQ